VALQMGERDVTLQPVPTLEETTYFFNPRELARLSVYRAAVIARFYTDQCEPHTIRYAKDVSRLLESVRTDNLQAA
jgi:hypothetical protein